MGQKEEKLVYSFSSKGKSTLVEKVSDCERDSFCLTEKQILKIANCFVKIELHYSFVHGCYCPVDVEWAIDGETEELFIVQARPETTHANDTVEELVQYRIDNSEELETLLEGIAVGDGVEIRKSAYTERNSSSAVTNFS